MSGLEIIGGISAVIEIISVSIKIYQNVRKDLKLSKTFELVATRLPVIKDTLEVCYADFKANENTLPADAVESVKKIVKSCEARSRKMQTIFEATVVGEDDQWYERYRKVARQLGKTTKVEELMRTITEDTQALVNYHTVKQEKPDLDKKLDQIIKEMKSAAPSLPIEESPTQVFNAGEGAQNISTGESTMHNNFNTGDGIMNNISGFSGTPTFNLGKGS